MTNIEWKRIKKDLKTLGFIDGQKACECIRDMTSTCRKSTLPLGFVFHLFFPTVCILSGKKFYMHVHHDKLGTQLGYECILSQLLIGEAQQHIGDICGIKLDVHSIELLWHTYCYDCILGNQTFPSDITDTLLVQHTSCDVIAYFGSVHISSTYSNFIDKVKVNTDESTNTDMFECPVCLEKKPHGVHVFKCGHMFCKECAIALHGTNIHNCPMCRAPMKEDKIEKDTVKTKIISELIEILFGYGTVLFTRHILKVGKEYGCIPQKLCQKDFIAACTYVRQQQQQPKLSTSIRKMLADIQTS